MIFAFFFAVAGARLELGAIREFWLAALIIFSGRAWLTYRGARIGLERAGASADLRTKTWQGLISQGGVTLGLLLLIEERFPTVGSDIVTLGMAVIIGNILVLCSQSLFRFADLGDDGLCRGGPAVAGARLELGAIREFWLAALIIFSGRAWLTYRGARIGLERAGASADLRTKTWQGLISQGGVTLGLLLLIEERFPTVGSDIVTLGMAVIIGNILGGPILLKRAITLPVLPEPELEPEVEPESGPDPRRPVEAETAVEKPRPPQRSAPDDWAGDA